MCVRMSAREPRVAYKWREGRFRLVPEWPAWAWVGPFGWARMAHGRIHLNGWGGHAFISAHLVGPACAHRPIHLIVMGRPPIPLERSVVEGCHVCGHRDEFTMTVTLRGLGPMGPARSLCQIPKFPRIPLA